MTEQEIQNRVRLELSLNGYVTFRINVGCFYTKDGRYIQNTLPKGFSDVLAVKKGKAFFLEIKTKKGTASKEQLDFIKTMKSYGCIAGIVRSEQEALDLCEGGLAND